MATIAEALKEALEPPEYYFGAITDLQRQGWARVWMRTRDSDNIAISNYETVLEKFAESYEKNEDFRVEGSNHWAHGWSDEILVRALDCECEDWEDADFYFEYSSDRFRCRTCACVGKVRPIFTEALELATYVRDHYPLLDEEDHSRREHEDLLEYIDNEMHWAYNQAETPDDFEVTVEDVASYLFDVHSVSSIDDMETAWIVDAIKTKYISEMLAEYENRPGQQEMEL